MDLAAAQSYARRREDATPRKFLLSLLNLFF
jgi:hypothetical protein